ncbi:CHAT domain-containing protein [Pseudoduganella namucuonensis]|nr:CHAT domain-containing protein [Pseudoduganella namucuonensis]
MQPGLTRPMRAAAAVRRAIAASLLALLALPALAPGVVAAQANGADSAFERAQARLRDAETIKALSAEGQLLYQKDRVKLAGAMYCAQSVALAERGEFRLAIEAASKALVLSGQGGDQVLAASAKRDLAIAYSYAGDLERAAQYAGEALAGAGRTNPAVAGPAHKTLADVAVRRGRLAEAVAGYQRAREAASARFRPLVDISLANAYVADGQLAQARALFGRLAPSGAASFDSTVLRQAYLRGLGKLALAEGDAPAAIRLFDGAAAQADGADAAYHRLWALEGRAAALLALRDRAGARAAYVAAARASEAIRARFRSEEFKTGLFGDVQRIFDQAIGLSMEAGDTAGAWNLSEASRSRALLDVVRERAALSRPGATAPLREAAPDLAGLRATLRDGEALVEFHTLDDRLLAWVVRRSGVKGHTLAVGQAALGERVGAFRDAILTRSKTVAAPARALHALLLEPLGLRPGERLLLVPHGALHYLPFQALRDGAGYLIESHALAYAPSAGVALQLARRGEPGHVSLAAFGNPGTDAKYALPAAQREVERIAGLFSDKRVFVREAASPRQFRASAAGAGVLHVAAHAQVDVIDPLQSRILLAPEPEPEQSPGTGSGFLSAREVYQVDLDRVALVTLSACESGLGRIARGDEILGFTRAFLSAGAGTLFVSLWPVADQSTEPLMTALYSEMAAGTEAALALQAAQIAVLRQPRFADPFFWAPFDLVGDWRLRIRV